MKKLFLSLIQIYQTYISPLSPPRCRYYPTCSSYAKEAIEIYGPYKGGYLALKRILRCNPFGGHGYDPVPLNCCEDSPSTNEDEPPKN